MQEHPPRRRTLLLAAAAWPALQAQPVRAQDWPSRPIRIIVGFAAGSASDNFARLYAPKLSEVLGTPVLIDNKPGAAQLTAIRAMQAAPADGYTLYQASGSSLAQGPGLRSDLPYDPLKDFALIGYLADLPGAVIVNANLPVRNVAELIAYAKANPGKLNFGSSGVGAAGHLSGELFMARTGTKMLHVPYKADTEAGREVAAGTLQVAFMTLRTAATLVAGGKVRALLITDTHPHPQLPQVPTVLDRGVPPALRDMVPYSWYALAGHPKLPESVVARLSEASAKVAAMPDYASAVQAGGVIPKSSTPAELRSFVETEIAKWRSVGRTVKIEF